MTMIETNEFGYGYRYEFRLDDGIIRRCKYTRSAGVKTFLVEIRSNFILRTMEGVEEILGTETFNNSSEETSDFSSCLEQMLLFRFSDEYLFSVEGYLNFSDAVVSFARQNADGRDVIPVAVVFDVCTLQKEGESLDDAMDRSIRVERLVPQYVVSVDAAFERCHSSDMNGYFINYLIGHRIDSVLEADREWFGVLEADREWFERFYVIQVKDLDQGYDLMRECAMCGRGPKLGNQIALLKCKHAFHWHCAVNWLERNDTCFTCGAKEHYFLFRRNK